MKILLIDPPFYRFMGIQGRYFPIGLGYIAASLREHGYKVKIYSADNTKVVSAPDYTKMTEHYDRFIGQVNDGTHPLWQDILAVLRSFQPDVVGITTMTPKIASALRTASVCKKYNNDLITVIGGPHATIKPDEILQYEDVDFVISGEGETTMVELIAAIENGIKDKFQDINGLAYRRNGIVVKNEYREFIQDIDTIPFPARDLLIEQENYSPEDLAIIMTSRGCPFSCTFCFKGMWGRKVRCRSIDNVIEEIKHVIEKYNARQFSFKDDSFTLDRKRIIELCDKLIAQEIKISWECTTRVDLIDEHLLKRMISAGCNIVKVGIESGSETVLKAINKNVTLEQVKRATGLFNKHGIFWSAYFMIGLPNETEEDVLKTLQFMKVIKADYASISIYEPYPGTVLFDLGTKLGLISPSMQVSQYFDRRPDQYYLANPGIRVSAIKPERFEQLSRHILDEFNRHNKKFTRLLKRGAARRKMYCSNPKAFFKDIKRVFKWIDA